MKPGAAPWTGVAASQDLQGREGAQMGSVKVQGSLGRRHHLCLCSEVGGAVIARETMHLPASVQDSGVGLSRQKDPGENSNKTSVLLGGQLPAPSTLMVFSDTGSLFLLPQHPRLIGCRACLFKFKSPWQG